MSDPYDPNLPWPEPGWNWSIPAHPPHIAWSSHTQILQISPIAHLSSNQTRPELPDDLPVDINFWFFLFIYYGAYLAVALIWVTCLFNLYRRGSLDSCPVPLPTPAQV